MIISQITAEGLYVIIDTHIHEMEFMYPVFQKWTLIHPNMWMNKKTHLS